MLCSLVLVLSPSRSDDARMAAADARLVDQSRPGATTPEMVLIQAVTDVSSWISLFSTCRATGRECIFISALKVTHRQGLAVRRGFLARDVEGHSRGDVQGQSTSAANASDRPHNQLSQCGQRFRSRVGTKQSPAESSMSARTRTSSGKRLPRSHRASACRKKWG